MATAAWQVNIAIDWKGHRHNELVDTDSEQSYKMNKPAIPLSYDKETSDRRPIATR